MTGMFHSRIGSVTVQTMTREVRSRVLGAVLLLAPSAAANAGGEAVSVAGSSDADGTVDRDTALIAVFLILLLIGVGAAVWFWRRKHQQLELQEEEQEEAAEVKDWLYKEGNEVKGPFSNKQMRAYWMAGLVNRSTKAKIVWWKKDFQPLSELFPKMGTEFSQPAKADEEEARSSDWHRFSVLAQPTGAAVPTLMWYYKLPDGKEEGPLESGKMRHWFASGYFSEDMLLRYEGADTSDFKALKDHFVDVCEAFNVLPNGCSPARARSTMQVRNTMQGRATQQGRISAANRGSVKSQAPRKSLLGSPGLTAELAEQGQASPTLTKLDVEPWRASRVSQGGNRASEKMPPLQMVGKAAD